MLDLLFAAALARVSPAVQTVFACPVRHKRIAITLRADRLTYTFGPPTHPDITLSGGPDGGVSYYRELYARGEDQTLRFEAGAWSYIVFQRWQAGQQLDHGKFEREYDAGGVLVLKDGKLVQRIDCDKGTSDMHEWRIFKQLKQDHENLTPEDA
jgi:hypothetical protein